MTLEEKVQVLGEKVDAINAVLTKLGHEYNLDMRPTTDVSGFFGDYARTMEKTMKLEEALVEMRKGKIARCSNGGAEFRIREGFFEVAGFVMPVERLTPVDGWTIERETFDWNEARKRMAQGKRVRRSGRGDEYTCRLDTMDYYMNAMEHAYVFQSSDFDAQWEQVDE